MESFIKQWEGTSLIQGLPQTNKSGKYKGFLALMCRKGENNQFYTNGIVALDDNLKPTSLVCYPDNITFECKFDVKKEDFKIEKLDTKLTAYMYSSEKYRFSFGITRDYCIIQVVK